MTDLAHLSAAELAALYSQRELSPVEVLKRVLARIERLEPRLNAFVLVDADRALSAAHASEDRWRRDAALGPLDGVPVSVKDLLPARGWPTRRGSRTVDARGRWDDDAPAVARLRESGAVLLGKTTTSEFGLRGTGYSPLTGTTRNPWNLAHTPGGSSAGAVVATAAGLGAIAIGTDGGGSIRVPSAYTGVIGLKPSFGRVPTNPPAFVGVPPHVGPIARSVTDLALALAVISRPDARDPAQVVPPFEPRALARKLTSLRIAYSETLGYASVDAEVAGAVREAVRVLRDAGANISEVELGLASPAPLTHGLFSARAAWTIRELDADRRAQLDPVVLQLALEGEQTRAVDYLEAEAQRIQLVQELARVHADYDLLLTPTSTHAAPPIDDAPAVRDSLAAPFSLTRQPALSIPCGLTRAGLPIGLQIVGRHYEEATVLALAEQYEQLRPFRLPPSTDAS